LKKLFAGTLLSLSLSLVLALPAFATSHHTDKATESTTLNGASVPTKTYYPNAGRSTLDLTNRDGLTGTGGMFGANGTGTYGTNGYGMNGTYGTYGTNGTYGGMYGANGTYGTGNYGAYGTNGHYGTYDSTRMNGYRPYSTNLTTRANNTVRKMETTTARRGFSWGWLGLLGLFGLAGMRSRNSDEVR